MRRRIVPVIILACAGNAPADENNFSQARALTNWSSAASMEKLNAASSPALRDVLEEGGGPAVIAQSFEDQLGNEQSIVDEQALAVNGQTLYQRLSRFENGLAITQLVRDEDGTVLAASVRPAPSIRPTNDAAPATELSLPFQTPREGAWLTFWGGDNIARNHHVMQPEQRYAYDFLVVRDGMTYSGPPETNTSYFCWGEPILAPAPGHVVRTVEDIPDNEIVGQMNSEAPRGNHVVIEHSAAEYSVLAHLQVDSVQVQEGQTVRAGETVGLCGNSGNSSEPHLHYHLQTPSPQSEDARGLPAPFHDYQLDGRHVEMARPVRGQIINPEGRTTHAD